MSEAVSSVVHAVGRERLLGHLAMIGFAALIAGSFSFGKQATPYIDPLSLNAVRFVVGAAAMGAFLFGVRRERFRVPEAPWRFALMGGLMAVYFVTMFIALGITSAVSTSAVFTLVPLMSAVIAFFLLGQIIRPVVALSLAFAATGAVWVIFHGDAGAILGFDIGKGEAIYFVGCIGHAFFTPLLRKFNRGEGSLFASFWVIVFTGLWIAIAGIGNIFSTDWTALPPLVWGVVAYLGIFTGTVTFFLMQYASLRLPASKVLAYGYLVPVFVIIIEGVVGHGWVSLSVALGALVTCLGLVVLYFSPD